MKHCTDEQALHFIAMFEEQHRLAGLSNKDLVCEYFQSDDTDLVIEEILSRVYPDWDRLRESDLRGN